MYCVRVSVAHFPRDITRLCWRVLACRACYGIYVYRYIDIVFHLWLVLCWLVLLVRSARVVSCCVMRALLSVVIWCTRAVIRCNRFSVLGGVVLPCALSCDCGAFYKCLLCVWLMV